jgi:hypothetical protein
MAEPMKTLGELAEIRTGYPFRGRIERMEAGGCRMVQMGDVRAALPKVGRDLAHVEAPQNWQKHKLQPSDVLFVGRGVRNDAAVFTGGHDDVIAAPHLFVLRARRELLPAFLVWFLNLPETQERIRSFRSGSALPFVPMEAFAKMPVPVPSLRVQEAIAAVQQLALQEQELLQQIKNKRRVLIDGLLLEALRHETKTLPNKTR